MADHSRGAEGSNVAEQGGRCHNPADRIDKTTVRALNQKRQQSRKDIDPHHHLPLGDFIFFEKSSLPHVREPVKGRKKPEKEGTHRPIGSFPGALGGGRIRVEERAGSNGHDRRNVILERGVDFSMNQVRHEQHGEGLARFRDLKDGEREELQRRKLAEAR